MIGLDWSGFLAVILLAIVICQAGAISSLRNRLHATVRNERLWHTRALQLQANAAESRSVVVELFPGALDERPGVETYGGAV